MAEYLSRVMMHSKMAWCRNC